MDYLTTMLTVRIRRL